MIKINRKVRAEQKARGVIFSSCLSEHRQEMEGDIVHEVFKTDKDINDHIKRLLDDKFFDVGHYKYNIIRRE